MIFSTSRHSMPISHPSQIERLPLPPPLFQTDPMMIEPVRWFFWVHVVMAEFYNFFIISQQSQKSMLQTLQESDEHERPELGQRVSNSTRF
jgi:hypothetical protein